MLQGAVPNLNISLVDGKPNQSASYNIRGVTSIGAGGSALVLIDGVEGDPAMSNPNYIEQACPASKDAACGSHLWFTCSVWGCPDYNKRSVKAKR